jgi:hypothetical protein
MDPPGDQNGADFLIKPGIETSGSMSQIFLSRIALATTGGTKRGEKKYRNIS